MFVSPQSDPDWSELQDAEAGLPAPLDSETTALFRSFLSPIIEEAQSWSDLRERLNERGYDLAFRAGHLVILRAGGEAICTGAHLGAPLRDLAERLGRPCVRADRRGVSGELG